MCLDSLDLVLEETRTTLKPPAAWPLLPDFLGGCVAVEKSLSWAETGEDSYDLMDWDWASTAWIQSHLWADAELVSKCLTVVNKAPHARRVQLLGVHTFGLTGCCQMAHRLVAKIHTPIRTYKILFLYDSSALGIVWLRNFCRSGDVKWQVLIVWICIFQGM